MAAKTETIKKLENELRQYHSEFSHVEFNGLHYIGRYNKKAMGGGNQITADVTYAKALRDAVRIVKREAVENARRKAKDSIKSITVLVHVTGRPVIPWKISRSRYESLFDHIADLAAGKM